MPYPRQTVAELIAQQEVDLSSRLGVPQDQVRHSNEGVIATVQAGGLHSLHGHLQWIVGQAFEDTAEYDYLRRRGEARDIYRKPSEAAKGSRVILGVEGSPVDTGVLLQRADGQQFTVTTGATISGGEASVEVVALVEGVASNTAETEPLSFVTPQAGVESVSPSGELVGGVEEEAVESYRSRVLDDIREPPHGGNDSDFARWVKSTPNVNVHRVWVFKKWMGLGSVGVFFTVDGGQVPDQATVDLVKYWVVDREATPEQEGAPDPVYGEAFIVAPTPAVVPLVVSGLNPDTPAVRKAAEFELADLFSRNANVENGSGNATLLLSHLREAISIASGERDHVVVSPAEDVTFDKGELPVFGGVTWT